MNAEILAASEQILARHGADLSDPSSVIDVTEELLQQMEDDLEPRLGKAAFRSIVQLSHQRAAKALPSLEQLILEPDIELSLWKPVPSSPGLDEELARGMVQLLAEVLIVVRRLARDQDWNQAQLWYPLRELDRQGVSMPPSDDDG